MGGMKKDKLNPGPKDEQFNQGQERRLSPTKKISTGGKPGMKDEQFNAGKSYDEDDGSGKSSDVDSSPGQISSVGSARMKDRQFTKKSGLNESSSNLSSRSSGGTPGKFDGQDLHPAAAIMREVARAVQNGPGPDQKYQGNRSVSSAKSSSQSKSYNDTQKDLGQSRPKTSTSQIVKEKPSQSKPGSYSKTSATKLGSKTSGGNRQY